MSVDDRIAGVKPRLGILAMLVAMSLVPMIDVIAKNLGLAGMPALQIAFMRMLFGTLLLFPVIAWHAPRDIFPRHDLRSALMLGCCNLGATGFFFASLKYLSIADTLAISFVQPLIVTVLSRFLLKENVTRSRWGALFVGFIATLAIIRPSSDAFNPASLLALASGACMACYVISIRSSRTRTTSLAKTFHTHSMALLVALPAAYWFWQPVPLAHFQMAILLATIGLVGQFLIIKAYEHSDASLIAPFAYTEMITSTCASWWFFDELPDQITFIGVSVLIGASLFISLKR